MDKKEFRALPKETKLVKIIYDYNNGTYTITYYPHSLYKNFGNIKRDLVNKYNHHYYLYDSSTRCSEAWCTEDKVSIALQTFKNEMCEQQEKIISEAQNNIARIVNGKVVIDNSYIS